MNDKLLSTPVTRVHWVHVFNPVNTPLNKERFKKKLTVMLEKDNPEHEEFKGYYTKKLLELVSVFPGTPDLRAVTWRDGDAPMKQGKNAGKADDNTRGYWLVTPWCDPKDTPVLRYLVGVEAHEAETSQHIYSGCFGRTSMRLYIYTKGTPGITCGLSGFVRTKDGPRLDNGVTEDDVLESLGIKSASRQLGTRGHSQGIDAAVMFPDITDAGTRATLGLPPL